jgi:hypothetical protein
VPTLRVLARVRPRAGGRSPDGPLCGPLAPWRETERALGISEASRSRRWAGIEAEPGPLGFQSQLPALADLCRQLARRLGYLRSRLSSDEREQVAGLLADLRQILDGFQ